MSYSAFYSNFSDCNRWDPISFCKMDWKWSEKEMQRLGDVLDKRQEPISKEFNFSALQPVTIHFDGSMDRRSVSKVSANSSTPQGLRNFQLLWSEIPW